VTSRMSEELAKLEGDIAGLRRGYDEATGVLVGLYVGRSKKKDRLAAFRVWCDAGTALFNACERLVSVASRAGAVDDSTWYTALAEDSVGILNVIGMHYDALSVRAADLGLSGESYRPSRTAFAGLQRLVTTTHPAVARSIRDDFVRGVLPTHGFDTAESSHGGASYRVSLWERVVASAAAALVVLCGLYAALRDTPFADPNQVVLLRTLLSFGVAALGAVIPGFLHVGVNLRGLGIRAGGALALFVLTYFYTPTVLPVPPPPVAAIAHAADTVPDSLEVVDVGFEDYEGDARAPRLDIKLTNRGVRTVYVKRVNVAVKRLWRLASWPTVGVVVPPSHGYVLRLNPGDAPCVASLAVSHGLKPGESDRFTVQLQEDPWPLSNTIYLADVELVSDGDDRTCRRADILFLITQTGASFPAEANLGEMVRAQRGLGRAVDPAEMRKSLRASKAAILEAAREGVVKSKAVQHLIDAASRSDIN